MLSSLEKLLQLKFELGHWKKIPNVKTLHCHPLKPWTPVFCENPSVHHPKGWQTHLHSKRKRHSSEQSYSQPDPPVLYEWWRSQRQKCAFSASVEGWEGTFPSSVLGGCSSSALQVPKQAYKYCRVSQEGAGKHRHMLKLPNAKQHSIQAKEKISKGFNSSE